MDELALFAGAGGGLLGSLFLGWTTRCAVEIDPYCRARLLQRQAEGYLERFPIWDDVQTFDGRPWRGRIDVISGGFPCQDISSANQRAKGIDGERSGLWREFARVIEEVEPAWVFVENSPYLRTRGLVRVLQDLARLGFDAEWDVFGADHVGAPHKRRRLWIVAAHPDRCRERAQPQHVEVGRSQAVGGPDPSRDWWPRDVFAGVDDGMAHRVDRRRATGNGQVPRVAAMAFRTLSSKLLGG